MPAGSCCSWIRPTHCPAEFTVAGAAVAAAAVDDKGANVAGVLLIAPCATLMYHTRPLVVSSTCRQPCVARITPGGAEA